jgi:hypothetical protein
MSQNRPLYETKSDKEYEKRAFPLIAKAIGGRARKLPDRHFADCVIVDEDGCILAYVEYKHRRMRWGDYHTIMLSAGKFLRLEEIRSLGVKSYFVVEDMDGDLRMLDLLSNYLKMRVVWGGRTSSTRDSMDIEPVCHFPIEEFRRIGNVKAQSEMG